MKVFEVVKQQKTAAFAFGRLNPATIGHELLVKEIQAQPGDAFLFLSDRPARLPDDPLEAQEKLDWARKSFNNIEIGLAKTALIAADRLFQLGYTDLIYLEGEPKMGKIIQDYNGKETKLHHYNFDTINLVRLTRNADADDATGMSASKLRSYAIKNDLIKFKKGVTDNAQPYAEEMFKTLQGKLGVSTEESIDEAEKPGIAQKIKPMKLQDPPKAPDATIPRWRDGYSTEDGTVYKQDKYNDNIMHVSDGGGTYTFDGDRLIKWTTPKIMGYRQIHDFVNKTIKVDADTTVNTGDGEVVVSTKAVYDLEGNLQNGGELGFSAGGVGVSLGDELKVDQVIGDNLSLHIRFDPNKKPSERQVQALKTMQQKAQGGSKQPLIDLASSARQVGASVTFKSPANGQAIPYRQGMELLRQAGG